MSDYQDALDRYRAAIAANDRQVAGEILRYFATAWRQIQQQLVALAGVDESYAKTRLEALSRQVLAEIRALARLTEREVLAAEADAVGAAQQDVIELITASLGAGPGVDLSFTQLPTEAFNDLVGTLVDGSPLRSLLDQFGPQASQRLRDILTAGLAQGQNPIKIAAELRAVLNGASVRALTIARTEILRSYRLSSSRIYQANSAVVQGWIWSADPGSGTCAMCWSMSGSRHSLDEQMDTHPRCRCAMIPWTKSWDALGFHDLADTAPEVPDGAEQFARLHASTQLKILGPGKYAAYQDGRIDLSDLVRVTHDPVWGTGRTEASLAEALANHGRGSR